MLRFFSQFTKMQNEPKSFKFIDITQQLQIKLVANIY